MTANGAVSWIEYVASLAALYVYPTTVAVVRHAGNIKLVLILNCIPIAWPAALLLACTMPRKAPPVATRCPTGVPSPSVR